MSSDRKIKVGSRKSELALTQTKHVISLLKSICPQKEFEIVTMNTLGDKVLDVPLPKIGEKSLFTKELETALENGSVDFVVHSLKDLPTTLPNGMAIGAVLTREDPRDALVLQKGLSQYTLSTLPINSIIGTSSLRRTAQLAKNYPHLKVENIRGNLNTRIKKLDDLGVYHAIILATAGLIRIGWKERISKVLSEEELLYAVGQGALAVECRADNEDVIKLLEPLYDLRTALRVTAERSFLRTLGGGCSAPVAVSSNFSFISNKEYNLILNGAVWSLDGKEEVSEVDRTSVIIEKNMKCARCPMNNQLDVINDIENLDCSKCMDGGPASKKSRVELSNEILKNDPHAHCPVEVPIGADFMGKCPYLENIDGGAYLVQNEIGSSQSLSFSKCPYLLELNKVTLKGSSNNLQGSIEANKTSVDLFCGLVPHKDATMNSMEKALRLGENLAQKLISRGALEIICKAQAIIHKETVQNITEIAS